MIPAFCHLHQTCLLPLIPALLGTTGLFEIASLRLLLAIAAYSEIELAYSFATFQSWLAPNVPAWVGPALLHR